MNIELLEELVRIKADHFQSKGISAYEAINRAGEEILDRMSNSGGHGSRFCLRMCLAGAKKRIRQDALSSSSPEGDKVCRLIFPVFKNTADRSAA